MKQIQRQGDVLLIPTAKPTSKTTAIPLEAGDLVVLTHSKVTDHTHAIEVESHGSKPTVDFVLNALTLERYIHARKPVTVRHEEHGALELPAGWYEVRIQREYERGAVRNVAD